MDNIDANYNEVYTIGEHEENHVIDSDVCYLTIPVSWIPTYRKLLVFVADFGKHILDDCSFSCKGDGSIVFNCWNVFQSACAAYASEDFARATLFKEYVDKQIDLIDKNINDTSFQYTITPDGAIKVNGTIMNNNVEFTANKSTYEKYKEWLEKHKQHRVYIKSS